MKKDSIEIVFILDASGSMANSRDDTIGGFNSLIADQKEVKGEANITLVTFDSKVKNIYSSKPLKDVEVLTKKEYTTSGTTALYDAIGFTIDDLEIRLSELEEGELPEKVMIVITTDGYENSSREYNQAIIKTRLEEKEEVGWDIIFIGANIDSYSEGAKMGVSSHRAANYEQSTEGTKEMYTVMSNAVRSVREHKVLDLDWAEPLKKNNKDE